MPKNSKVKKILLLEDDKTMAGFYANRLTEAGFQVKVHASTEGLSGLCNEFRPTWPLWITPWRILQKWNGGHQCSSEDRLEHEDCDAHQLQRIPDQGGCSEGRSRRLSAQDKHATRNSGQLCGAALKKRTRRFLAESERSPTQRAIFSPEFALVELDNLFAEVKS